MAKQLHMSFRDRQVKSLLQSYINKEVELPYILNILKIGRSRFFALLRDYRQNPPQFSIAYKRRQKTRTISPEIDQKIDIKTGVHSKFYFAHGKGEENIKLGLAQVASELCTPEGAAKPVPKRKKVIIIGSSFRDGRDKYMLPDGIHYNDDGHEIWGRAIAEFIEKFL